MYWNEQKTCEEEINELREENKRLRKALQDIADCYVKGGTRGFMLDTARKALEE